MKLETFLSGVEEIYNEKPAYKVGHDGSDGYCDCIGMVKGAIRRGGGNASGLQGTNYAARYTIKGIKEIVGTSDLAVGDVVLKSRKEGASGYDLPDSYKKGGSNYNGDLTDYCHIGVVTGTYPIEITHMTSPTAKKDTKLGKWSHVGQLPQIDGGEEPGVETIATVTAPTGSTVNMRKSASVSAPLVERVPIGSSVEVIDKGDDWCKVRWNGRRGYMMTKFLSFDDAPPVLSMYTVVIQGLSKAEAFALCEKYTNAEMSIG